MLFTSRPDRVCDVVVNPGLSTSDHHLVKFRLRRSPGKLPHRFRENFQYHKADANHFHNQLNLVPWDLINYADIDGAWEMISDLFIGGFIQYVHAAR